MGQQSMVFLLQVERTTKVTMCIAVNGAAVCSKNQICLPFAKRLAKPKVAGNRHNLRLTGLSKASRGMSRGLQIVDAAICSACLLSCGN